MKVRESRCTNCYVKITQTGKGRTAKVCSGCRARRADEWRAAQQPKNDPVPEKHIDVVGGDNAD